MNLFFHGTLFPRKSGFSRKFDSNPFVSFGDDFVESALCCLLLPVTWFLSPSELFALFLWKGGFFSLSLSTPFFSLVWLTLLRTLLVAFHIYFLDGCPLFISTGCSFVVSIRSSSGVSFLTLLKSSELLSCAQQFSVTFFVRFQVIRPSANEIDTTAMSVRWMSFGRLFQTESTWEYFIVRSSICYRVTFENSNFQHFIDNLVTWQKQTRTHRFINGFFQPTTTLRQALDVFELSLSTIRQLFLLLLCYSVPLGFFQLISSITVFSDSATEWHGAFC